MFKTQIYRELEKNSAMWMDCCVKTISFGTDTERRLEYTNSNWESDILIRNLRINKALCLHVVLKFHISTLFNMDHVTVLSINISISKYSFFSIKRAKSTSFMLIHCTFNMAISWTRYDWRINNHYIGWNRDKW